MSNGGPARDAAFSANQAKLGILDRLSAADIAAGRINVSYLLVQGVPIRDYVCSLISECGLLTSFEAKAPDAESPLTSAPEAKTAAPEEEEKNHEISPPIVSRSLNTAPTTTNPSIVEFAQVASRAAHAHVADIAHGYHDPVNGHKGYVLTADEYGQGSWQILPESNTGDVEGPLQSLPDSLAIFDTSNGRLLRDCKIIVEKDDTLVVPQVKTERVILSKNATVPVGTLAVKGLEGDLTYDSNLTQTFHDLVQQVKMSRLAPAPVPAPIQTPVPTPVLKAPPDALPFSTPVTAYNGDLQWTPVQTVLMPWASHEEWTNAVPIHYKGNLLPSKVIIDNNGGDLHSQSVYAKSGILEKVTSDEIMADELTVQNLSVVELHIPEGAQNNFVLTSNADGKCTWTAPPPPTVVPDNLVTAELDAVATRTNLVTTSDEKCLKIRGSVIQVDLEGTLFAHNIQFASPDCALRTSNNDILLHQTGDGICLLGTQAHTFVAGAGAMQHAATSLKHILAWGAEALQYAEVDELVGLGYRALSRLKTGQGNVAVGPYALSQNETGHFCTAVGHNCLPKSKSSANTGLGAGCFSALEDGWHNTGVGTGAGEHLVHGSNNVVMGDGAGPKGDFHNTICLGRNAQATGDGDWAMGSREAPLRITKSATSGDLTALNPTGYLNITLNGAAYKIPLFLP